MAITSRRTGLKPMRYPSAETRRSELIWMLDAGYGVLESHRGESHSNLYLGRCLDFLANRPSQRELVHARNDRRGS